jgi:hypothetical protein
MKHIKSLVAITAFSLVVLALPSVASAQYYPNGGYGGYGNGSYNRNIRGTVQNLKNRARNFERTTNRVEDRNDRNDRWGDRDDRWGNRNGGYYGSGNIGRLEDLADRFKRATDDLADEYGNGRNLNNSREEARRVLDIGNQIEQELSRTRRGNNNLYREWNMIRHDLNTLSQVYGYGYNRNRNGNWRNNIPFPLPF